MAVTNVTGQYVAEHQENIPATIVWPRAKFNPATPIAEGKLVEVVILYDGNEVKHLGFKWDTAVDPNVKPADGNGLFFDAKLAIIESVLS